MITNNQTITREELQKLFQQTDVWIGLDTEILEKVINDDFKQEHNLDKKSKRQFRKWLKKKRKTYQKYFKKEWGPWDGCHLLKPIQMIIADMFEYYCRGNNVVGTPVQINENGDLVENDTRIRTLACALGKLNFYGHCVEENDDYELEQKALIDAFRYIAQHINEWWD